MPSTSETLNAGACVSGIGKLNSWLEVLRVVAQLMCNRAEEAL